MTQSDDEAQTSVDRSSLQVEAPRGTTSDAQGGESVPAGLEPLVTILTFCAHPALAYGTLLIFKSVRVGFPNARIEVFDNGSHPDVLPDIERAAAEVGASFEAMTPRHYVDHYRWLLLGREHDRRPLVIVDPDVIFWERVEHWQFGDAVMAGRLMKLNSHGNFFNQPRLHPSLLWIPDVARLRVAVRRREIWYRFQTGKPWDCVRQCVEREGERLFCSDTMAQLYQALSDECAPFRDEHLDCYDHLFFGSHLPVLDHCQGPNFDVMREGHRAAATGDLASIRGIWRRQEEYFSAGLALKDNPGPLLEGLLASSDRIQRWQNLNLDDEQLYGVVENLIRRSSDYDQGSRSTPNPAAEALRGVIMESLKSSRLA
jgi:hypothetical protein